MLKAWRNYISYSLSFVHALGNSMLVTRLDVPSLDCSLDPSTVHMQTSALFGYGWTEIISCPGGYIERRRLDDFQVYMSFQAGSEWARPKQPGARVNEERERKIICYFKKELEPSWPVCILVSTQAMVVMGRKIEAEMGTDSHQKQFKCSSCQQLLQLSYCW